jgi:hypothetical protein
MRKFTTGKKEERKEGTNERRNKGREEETDLSSILNLF